MFPRIIFAIFAWLDPTEQFTHWYLDSTDDVFKPIHESALALKKEFEGSIHSFQEQEKELMEIKNLQKDLIQTRHILEEAEEEVDLEPNHYKNDPNCTSAGKKLPDFDLYQTTVIHPTMRNIETKSYFKKCTDCPECRTAAEHHRFFDETRRNLMPYCTVIDEKWRMNPFDHLDGIQAMDNYQEIREHALTPIMYFMGNKLEDFPLREAHQEAYKDGKDLGAIGHCITIGLSRDHDDWVLFNLASIYWRIKGLAREAIECGRRAYLLAPNEYRDMALVNMANVIHKQGFTKNATVLLETAIEIYPYSLNHFALGNMYSVLEEYKRAILHFSAALRYQSNFEEARLRRHAVMCQAKLHHKLEQQFESLNKTLSELRKFKDKQDEYRLRLGRLEDRQAKDTEQLEYQKIFNMFAYNKPLRTSDRYSIKRQLALEVSSEFRGQTSSGTKRNKSRRYASKGPQWSNEFYTINSDGIAERQEFYTTDEWAYTPWTHADWPSLGTCDQHASRYPAWNEYPTWYIDPGDRGFNVTWLLSGYIGLDQYDLALPNQPWRRPHCNKVDTLDYIKFIDEIDGVKYRGSYPDHLQDQYQLRKLLMHINLGHVWPDAIGERIMLAAEKAKNENPEHLWVLFNIAALYWRVNGGNRQAIECLRLSTHHAPYDHQDVPMIQLALIMYRFGRYSDTHQLLQRSIVVKDSEPITYLAVGIQQMAMNNATGASLYFSHALYLQPNLQEAFHCLFIAKCIELRDKYGVEPQPNQFTEEHLFWERAWKPEFWHKAAGITHQTYLNGPADEFELVKEKQFPDESDDDRKRRMELRHERFGKMAEKLSLESEFPVRVEHIELLLELIEDELRFKKSSGSALYQHVELGNKEHDENLKYRIARSLIEKLTKVRDFTDAATVMQEEVKLSTAKDEL